MAIDDLWVLKSGSPSQRAGRGRRYRVRVDGYPASLYRTLAEARRAERERIAAGPPTPASTVTVGRLIDRWLDTKRDLPSFDDCEDAAMRVRPRWGRVLAADVSPTRT